MQNSYTDTATSITGSSSILIQNAQYKMSTNDQVSTSTKQKTMDQVLRTQKRLSYNRGPKGLHKNDWIRGVSPTMAFAQNLKEDVNGK